MRVVWIKLGSVWPSCSMSKAAAGTRAFMVYHGPRFLIPFQEKDHRNSPAVLWAFLCLQEVIISVLHLKIQEWLNRLISKCLGELMCNLHSANAGENIFWRRQNPTIFCLVCNDDYHLILSSLVATISFNNRYLQIYIFLQGPKTYRMWEAIYSSRKN